MKLARDGATESEVHTGPTAETRQITAARISSADYATATKARLRLTTAEDNAQILTDLRRIVRSQLTQYKIEAERAPFSPGQATALHKLAQTYALLDSHTEREHAKYDFSANTSQDLTALEPLAKALLGE